MTAGSDEIMTNREFVALVRAKLEAAGHRDVPIDRQWIDEETLLIAPAPACNEILDQQSAYVNERPKLRTSSKPLSVALWVF